jgi:hypothetical protein
VPGQGNAGEIEPVEQRGQVIGESVEFVSLAGVIGPAVPPAVVGDGAESALCEVQHLVLPHVTAHQHAVDEHDRAPGAPVSVEQLGPVGSIDTRHFWLLFSVELLRAGAAARPAAARSAGLLRGQGFHGQLVVLPDEAVLAEKEEDAGGPGDLAVRSGQGSLLSSARLSRS